MTTNAASTHSHRIFCGHFIAGLLSLFRPDGGNIPPWRSKRNTFYRKPAFGNGIGARKVNRKRPNYEM